VACDVLGASFDLRRVIAAVAAADFASALSRAFEITAMISKPAINPASPPSFAVS
jgi:hypothetical protein